MGSLNRIELIGSLGKAPDIRVMDNGTKVATFSLATNEPAYKLANGTQVPERTDWHNVVAWGGYASIAEKYLKKGSITYIEGKVRTRSYDDKQGVKRYVTEVHVMNIVLLPNPNRQEATQQDSEEMQQRYENHSNNNTGYTSQNTVGDGGDDLPF